MQRFFSMIKTCLPLDATSLSSHSTGEWNIADWVQIEMFYQRKKKHISLAMTMIHSYRINAISFSIEASFFSSHSRSNYWKHDQDQMKWARRYSAFIDRIILNWFFDDDHMSSGSQENRQDISLSTLIGWEIDKRTVSKTVTMDDVFVRWFCFVLIRQFCL